jgi:predicted dehydrogenase
MKVAVVGCGRIAQAHAAAVRCLDDGAALVFCDLDADSARRTAAAFGGGPAYHGDPARFQSAQLVGEPPAQPGDPQADLAIRALSARAAVLVEKPLALSRAETLIASTLRESRCPASTTTSSSSPAC